MEGERVLEREEIREHRRCRGSGRRMLRWIARRAAGIDERMHARIDRCRRTTIEAVLCVPCRYHRVVHRDIHQREDAGGTHWRGVTHVRQQRPVECEDVERSPMPNGCRQRAPGLHHGVARRGALSLQPNDFVELARGLRRSIRRWRGRSQLSAICQHEGAPLAGRGFVWQARRRR